MPPTRSYRKYKSTAGTIQSRAAITGAKAADQEYNRNVNASVLARAPRKDVAARARTFPAGCGHSRRRSRRRRCSSSSSRHSGSRCHSGSRPCRRGVDLNQIGAHQDSVVNVCEVCEHDTSLCRSNVHAHLTDNGERKRHRRHISLKHRRKAPY